MSQLRRRRQTLKPPTNPIPLVATDSISLLPDTAGLIVGGARDEEVNPYCDALPDITKEDDIIIACVIHPNQAANPRIYRKLHAVFRVMGAMWSGKTPFIRAVVGETAQAVPLGHGLPAGTHPLDCYKIPITDTYSHLVLLEIPAFSFFLTGSYKTTLPILREWLKSSYQQGKKLDGVVYLHTIDSLVFNSHTAGTVWLFGDLFDGHIFDRLCLTSTNWAYLSPEQKLHYDAVEKRIHKQEKGNFLSKNSITSRFDSTTEELGRETAIKTIRSIVQHLHRKVISKMRAYQQEVMEESKTTCGTTSRAGIFNSAQEVKIAAQIFQLDKVLASSFQLGM